MSADVGVGALVVRSSADGRRRSEHGDLPAAGAGGAPGRPVRARRRRGGGRAFSVFFESKHRKYANYSIQVRLDAFFSAVGTNYETLGRIVPVGLFSILSTFWFSLVYLPPD